MKKEFKNILRKNPRRKKRKWKEGEESQFTNSKKGKTFLIIFNLFYTYSRGESSADKRSKDYNSIEKVIDDELKVIKKKESSRKEVDDELEVIKRKSSKKEIEEELDVIKEKSSWKLNSIKKEVDDK